MRDEDEKREKKIKNFDVNIKMGSQFFSVLGFAAQVC